MSNTHLSLAELLGYVKQAIAVLTKSSGALWVTAEVLNVSGNPHRYLELVEYDGNRKELAKIKGMIWADQVSMLERFKSQSGMAVAPGMKLLLKVKPTFHEVFGVGLTILEIDASYTLGDMETRVKAIREYLIEKQWIGLNKALSLPTDFTRVAVIAPADAAGLGDFKVVADRLDSHQLCSFEYFTAAFQGIGSADSIVAQMTLAYQKHQAQPYDCLILIRGGGDKAGLYQLNDRRLAASVCRFPAPVFVGIGHERDKVFIEEVAAQRFATPSLLISHVQRTIVDQARTAEANLSKIKLSASGKLDQLDTQCRLRLLSLREEAQSRTRDAEVDADQLREQVLNGAMRSTDQAFNRALGQKQRFYSEATSKLADVERKAIACMDEIGYQSMRKVDEADTNAGQWLNQVMSANPLAILARGYAYVQGPTGYITRPEQVQAGESITLHQHQFNIHAIVKEITHHEQ